MATEGQRKEIFDKLKIVVKDIIESNGFTPGVPEITITGEDFYNKFISLFDSWKSPIIKRGISSNKDQIIELYNHIYENNTEDILMLANAGGKPINVRTMNVMDFFIRKVQEITGYNVLTYWEEYKRENPTGGRRRFRTKKRKTKKYKKISKRNRKF
jgi:hypothetical protein